MALPWSIRRRAPWTERRELELLDAAGRGRPWGSLVGGDRWMDGSTGLSGRGDRGRRRLRLIGAKGIWEDPEVGDECGGGRTNLLEFRVGLFIYQEGFG